MFAQKLDELLQTLDITQYRLAKETGIPQSGISQYRSGKVEPTLERLVILADYFEVTTDYLLGRTELRNGNSPDDKLTPAEMEIIRALRENPDMEMSVRLLLRLPVAEEPAKRA